MHELLRIKELPDAALDAAAAFTREYLTSVRGTLAGGADLTIVLPQAPYDHRDWRRALARDLARAHAPARINVIAGSGDARISAAADYLANAPGVTGQYLELARDE